MQTVTLNINGTHPRERAAARVQPIDPERIALAKAAYTTRRVPLDKVASLLTGDLRPEPGDLVLARVERIRQHARLELQTGRRAPLFEGDEVVVCYGHRYAPDQFEAQVPEDLRPCHLVAAGGIAAEALSRHTSKKPATGIHPLGLMGDANGRRINLRDWSLPKRTRPAARPLTIAVIGTSMNAGKTTTAAHLVRGLRLAQFKVGAAKITGTGAGGDVWLMQDAGASPVVDFVDAGFASTFRASNKGVEGILTTLTGHLADAGADVIVLEVADGLLQQETAQLLSSAVFQQSVDGILFAAGDAMGASAGLDWLQRRSLNVFGLSGSMSASPLASREAEQATGLPVLRLSDLSDPKKAAQLLEQAGGLTALSEAI